MSEQLEVPEPSKAGLTADELEAKRISRRAAIKRAAAVAGAVWVAPTIIDSLASPAAAATAQTKGVHYFTYNISTFLWQAFTTNSCDSARPAGGDSPAVASNAALAASYGLSASHTTPLVAQNNTITFQIAGGFSCRVLFAVGSSTNGGGNQLACQTPATGSTTTLLLAANAKWPTAAQITTTPTRGLITVAIQCP